MFIMNVILDFMDFIFRLHVSFLSSCLLLTDEITLTDDTEATEAAGVSAGARRLHQRRTEEPEEGIPSCPGGGEAHSERSTCHWTVPRSCRSKQWHCRINDRYKHRQNKSSVFFDDCDETH